MPVVAIEAIVRIALFILEWVVTKKANDKALREAFVRFAELARTENIKTIIARTNAEKQLLAGNAKWDQIEAVEKAKGKSSVKFK